MVELEPPEMTRHSEYSKGAIVKVRLRNFVTYSDLKFQPGPFMNMVIGPNGTGKSTIVCALALGLGGSPEILGRGKFLNDFIMHGKNAAVIDLELENSPKNVTIRRSFDRESNQSKWKINGKNSTILDVKKLIQGFNIQVDNLCQFLPQDKVSEFAAMDAAKLLRETQRAADKDLLKKQDFLANGQSMLKTLESKLKTSEHELAALKEKNQRLEGDVERLNQKDAIEAQIKEYKVKLIIAQYEQEIENYNNAKEAHAKATEIYENASLSLGPLNYELENAKTSVTNSAKGISSITKRLTRQQEEFNGFVAELSNFEKQIEDYERKITSNMQKDKDRNNKIKQRKKELEEATKNFEKRKLLLIERELLQSDGTESSTSLFEEKLKKKWLEAKKAQHNLNAGRPRFDQAKKDFITKYTTVRKEKDEANRKLLQLDDVQQRKLETLQNQNRQVYDAIMWLRENKEMFVGRIHEPLAISLKLVDPKYGNMVESLIPWKEQMAFVCEKRDDYFTLREELIKKRNLYISIHCIDIPLKSMLDDRIPDHILSQYKFNGVLLDTVTGEDAIMAFLCKNLSFHKIPFSTEAIQSTSLRMLEDKFPRFVNGIGRGCQAHITNSAYGAASTRLQSLEKLVFFKATVDPEEKTRLIAALNAASRKLSDLESEKSNLEEQEKEFVSKRDQITKALEGIQKERETGLNMLKDHSKNSIDLEFRKDRIENLESQPSCEDTNKEHNDTLIKLNCDRVDLLCKVEGVMRSISELSSKGTICTLAKELLERRVKAREQDIENASGQFKKSKDDMDLAKELRGKYKDRARIMHQAYDSERKKALPQHLLFFTEPPNEEETPTFLEDKIVELEERIGLVSNVDPEIIIQYNSRKKQIEDVSRALEFKRLEIQEQSENFMETFAAWKASLEEIVCAINVSFTDAFKTIGAVGEVRLREDAEDYFKWGIEILVKFRDKESLQVLTAQRQSGGERSVSTMLYLVALQNLVKSPFRVVDEINQGMDPKNERLVHKIIVNAACTTNTSQYFLITPKLLPDLDYHEKMRIILVMNGPWLPEGCDWEKIQASLSPSTFELFDDSALHANHKAMADRSDLETHFRMEVTSEIFVGLPLIKRHRLVNNILKQEFENGLHALQIVKAKTKSEE